VLEEWVAEGKNPEKADELTLLRTTLKLSLAKYSIDLLLEKSGLLNADTAAMSGADARQLIAHICSNEIDWTRPDSIESRMRIVEQIASTSGVQLGEVFDELVNSWLPGAELAEVVHSDPDATIDFTATATSTTQSGASDSELVVPVLYSDPKISRIVLLLRNYSTPGMMVAKARMMGHQIEQVGVRFY